MRNALAAHVPLLQAFKCQAFVTEWMLPDGTVGASLSAPLGGGEALQAVVFLSQSETGWALEGWVERDADQVGETFRADAPWHSLEEVGAKLAGDVANALLREVLAQWRQAIYVAIDAARHYIKGPFRHATFPVGRLEPKFASEHIFVGGGRMSPLKVPSLQATGRHYGVVIQEALPLAGTIPAWMAADRVSWVRARKHE